MAIYCSKCGKQQPDDAIFCMACGQPLKADRESIQAAIPSSESTYGNQRYQPSEVQSPAAYGNYGQKVQQSFGPHQQWGETSTPIGALQAPQKKRRTGLAIVLLILLLVLMGASISGYFIFRSTPQKTLSTPQRTLQAYCNALLKNNAQGLDDQLSTRAQSNVANIAAGLQRTNDPSIGGIKTCTYSNVQQSGSNATATITVTVGNTTLPAIMDHVVMIDENGSWKIDGGQDPAFT